MFFARYHKGYSDLVYKTHKELKQVARPRQKLRNKNDAITKRCKSLREVITALTLRKFFEERFRILDCDFPGIRFSNQRKRIAGEGLPLRFQELAISGDQLPFIYVQ